MYPTPEGGGFQQPCPFRHPTQGAGLPAALQPDCSGHPRVYDRPQQESGPCSRRPVDSLDLPLPHRIAHCYPVTTHVHTKPCSRRWSTACAFAERYPYFTTDRPMDGGSVLLTQPIAQGPIPFLPTPEGGGILGG